MKDYHAQGRKIGVAFVGACVVALFAYRMFSNTEPKTVAESPEEAACLQRLVPTMEMMEEQGKRYTDSLIAITQRYSESKSKPEYDMAMAQLDLREKAAKIAANTAYCNGYAKCFPTKQFKPLFDSCYAVFSDTSDEDADRK